MSATRGGAGMSDSKDPEPSAMLLFIPGEPFRYADPAHGHHYNFAMLGTAGSEGGASGGGHTAADALPGQVYGPAARSARMVVEIAQRHGLSVKVVDVDSPGEDRSLVERYVSADDDLPILIRPDGARLSGDDAFVPKTVERFVLGR
jgi:hypothetical protein